LACLLGVDNGLTVTKAVVFDESGRALGVARRRIAQRFPSPRHVERDMDEMWRETAEAIREAVALSGRPICDLKAAAVTAHGDGLYLIDRQGRALGPGVLSLDSRAIEVMQRWRADGVFDAGLALTGQSPHVSAPAALLAWIAEHEPQRFAAIGAVLSAKDWLRLKLTGIVATDPTEASASFTDPHTQTYSEAALRLYGLEALAVALPPIKSCDEVVGGVSAEAAELCGLTPGLPVVAGLHDVTASALGIGAHEPEKLAIVAGTYSINEVVSSKLRLDARWMARNGVAAGFYNNMAISPASTANYDWFIDTFCKAEAGVDIHEMLAAEIVAARARPSTALFHPYLFGSPFGEAASGAFFGLRGWHDRGDALRALMDGVVFNHRVHVDALREGFEIKEIRLTGGGSRTPAFAQTFADALGAPVSVVAVDEAAAFGAALCAGAGVGLYASPQEGARALVKPASTYLPDARRREDMDRRYAVFRRLAEALAPVWPEIEALG
jgi:L-xylulokinase